MSKRATTKETAAEEVIPGSGVHLFTLPTPAHLTIADFPTMDQLKDFVVRRVYVWNPDDMEWYADHAHSQGQELFIAQEGRVEIWLHDGKTERTVMLTHGQALFVPTNIWHKVRKIDDESHLIVCADVTYDREAHYEEDFQQWLAEA